MLKILVMMHAKLYSKKSSLNSKNKNMKTVLLTKMEFSAEKLIN
jgi:hypothetical protein